MYIFQLPHPRDGRELDYSRCGRNQVLGTNTKINILNKSRRWQQSLIGVLQVDIEYDEEEVRPARVQLMVEANEQAKQFKLKTAALQAQLQKAEDR